MIEWISWVDEDGNTERESAIRRLYYLMNPIGDKNFNGGEVNTQFNNIFVAFKKFIQESTLASDVDFQNKVGAYLQKKNTNNSSTQFVVQFDEYLDDFGIVLKGYLMEFAYSHHYCNQIKSNHFLKKNPTNLADTNTKVHQYYNYLYAAVSSGAYRLSDDYNIKPDLPNKNKIDGEKQSIAIG